MSLSFADWTTRYDEEGDDPFRRQISRYIIRTYAFR